MADTTNHVFNFEKEINLVLAKSLAHAAARVSQLSDIVEQKEIVARSEWLKSHRSSAKNRSRAEAQALVRYRAVTRAKRLLGAALLAASFEAVRAVAAAIQNEYPGSDGLDLSDELNETEYSLAEIHSSLEI